MLGLITAAFLRAKRVPPLIYALVVICGLLAWVRHQEHVAKERARHATIAYDSLLAESAGLRKQRDGLYRTLAVVNEAFAKRPVKVVTKVVTHVDTVTGTSEGTAELQSDTVRIKPRLDSVPFHVEVDVALTGSQYRARWSAALDPIQLGAELSCAPAPNVALTTPPWLQVDSLRVETTPDVCPERYQISQKHGGIPWWSLPLTALGTWIIHSKVAK